VHVLVKVHHLESIELVGDFLNLFFLAGLNCLHALSIPLDVGSGSFLVLSTSFDCATGELAIMDVLNSVVAQRAGLDSCSAHVEELYSFTIRTTSVVSSNICEVVG
jgi:hypothetical protein